MQRAKIVSFGAIGLLALAALVYGVYAALRGESYIAPNESQLTSLAVEQPFLVARGRGLSRVEFWAVPTGTGIAEQDYTLLGKAQSFSAEGNGEQVWKMSIPSQPILATEIFAKGFTRRGEDAGRVALSVTGATAIYDMLWGGSSNKTSTITEADQGKTFSYKPGDRFSIVLTQRLFTQADLWCNPAASVRELGNVPSVEIPLYGTLYEALQPGTCKLEAGDFEVTITIVP